MKFTCIAVDDEVLALDVVQTYVERLPWLQLKARCLTATDALAVLRQETVDILFLDIQLPDITGMEMLRSLHRPPLVIFTTAFEQYAVESYTVDAVDYLVKPFSFERFLNAVHKAEVLLAPSSKVIDGGDTLFIHTEQGDLRIAGRDVLYIKSLSEYAIVRTVTKEYLVRESLREIEMRIARLGFLRVHKSYIVSIPNVSKVENNVIRVGDAVIPVGKTYRDAVRHFVERFRIG
ncbi:MAG: response regulator transcription factor [Bacteroidia bacterium]|nr:response regulator transcription factor [Bacteroidia bacterium]